MTLTPYAFRGATPPLTLFTVAVIVELVAVAADSTIVQWIAKPLLAPLLIWHVLDRRWRRDGKLLDRERPGDGRAAEGQRRRGRRASERLDLVVVALVFATAGDIALLVPGTTAFLVGMLFFLGAQVSLIVAFVRPATAGHPTHPGVRRPYSERGGRTELSTGAATRGPSMGGIPRLALIGYGGLWITANALLWGQLGPLRGPVLVYSLALTAMAAAAARVSRRVAVGGALFLISDLLIGLGAAGMHAPVHDVLVMATYSAALALIATGWAVLPVDRREGPETADPGPLVDRREGPEAADPARPSTRCERAGSD